MNVTFQFWTAGAVENVRNLIVAGHGIISSLGWYLDGQCVTWEDCYSANPVRALKLNHLIDRSKIVGLETCAWELSEENLDTENAWTRILAVSEHMWSSLSSGELIPKTLFTERRLMHLCHLLANEMRLFPPRMCSKEANVKKAVLKHTTEFRRREVERDSMICRRASKNNPLRCRTHNCVRGGL